MAHSTPPSGKKTYNAEHVFRAIAAWGKKTYNADPIFRVILALLGVFFCVYFCVYFALVDPKHYTPNWLNGWVAGLVDDGQRPSSPAPSAWQPARPAPSTPPPPPPPPPRLTAEDLYRLTFPHLADADRQSRAAIEPALKPLDDLFQGARSRSRYFADDIVGMSSMWRAAVDLVPGTSGDRLKQYVRRCLEERIFTERAVQQAVEQCVRDYQRTLEAIDNQLLVRIQRDFHSRLADNQLGSFADSTLLQREYQRLVRRMVAEATDEAIRGVTDLVILEVINTVLIQLAARSGVTTVILGAGATSALSSGGVSILVSTVIAFIVDRIYNWVTDPAGQLADKLNQSLDEVHRTLVRGTQGSPGLHAALEEVARNRHELRQRVIRNLIVEEIQP